MKIINLIDIYFVFCLFSVKLLKYTAVARIPSTFFINLSIHRFWKLNLWISKKKLTELKPLLLFWNSKENELSKISINNSIKHWVSWRDKSKPRGNFYFMKFKIWKYMEYLSSNSQNMIFPFEPQRYLVDGYKKISFFFFSFPFQWFFPSISVLCFNNYKKTTK